MRCSTRKTGRWKARWQTRVQTQPLDIVLTDELRHVLDQALAQLPVAQRAALELKSLGHSLEEIAEALSITANHAGVLVHRARRAVRERVARYEIGKGP